LPRVKAVREFKEILSSAGVTTNHFKKSKISSTEVPESGNYACLIVFDWRHNKMKNPWFNKKFTQLAPYLPRSPNKGDRMGGADPQSPAPICMGIPAGIVQD